MDARLLLGVVGAWVLFAVGAIANGILREALLEPRMPAAAAGALSVGILVGAILAVVFLLVRRPWARLPRASLWRIGGAWLVMTVAFESLFGHYVLGTPWADLVAAYDVFAGSLWPVVPLAMLLAAPLARYALERRTRLPAARRGLA